MKKLIAAASLAGALSGAALVSAQDSAVRDMTGHVPTEQEYIDALKPREGSQRQTRGVAAVPAAKGPAQCNFAPKGNTTRGIATTGAPVSDAVAVKVEFASGSSNITPEAAKTLDELGKALTSDALKQFCFVIEGHTDNVGSESYNDALSERRAQSVVRYLGDHFRVDTSRIQAVGYGMSKPIADNSTDQGRQKNRRVQIANVGG